MRAPTTPSSAFRARRERLATRHPGPIALASGFSRPRNFPGLHYPFRAESHFAYLVGPAPEGALLFVHGDEYVLFVDDADPDEALWVGPQPAWSDVFASQGLRVRPLDAFEAPEGLATLPPQDAETAEWLSSLVDRDVEPGSGDSLDGVDAALADALIDLRLLHDEAALAQMRAAVAVTADAHRAGMRATRAGDREAAVRAAMEAVVIGQGMTMAYPPIVTRRGEVLHCETYDGVLEDGDLLLADVGAETAEGWASDVTRTWPASGRFSATQRALYDVVLAAQRAAIDTVAPGRRYLHVHRAAAATLVEGLVALGILRGSPDELAQRGAAAWFFPHGIGHLLGLDVHDMEDLGDRAGYAPGRQRPSAPGDRYLRLDRDLAPGMVVTIEPGFYQVPPLVERLRGDPLAAQVDFDALDRFSDVRGIRIEDDVLVTQEGAEVLTAGIPKDPEDIERAMG
jgi:Xaa-Pro aminopeptidase